MHKSLDRKGGQHIIFGYSTSYAIVKTRDVRHDNVHSTEAFRPRQGIHHDKNSKLRNHQLGGQHDGETNGTETASESRTYQERFMQKRS